MAQPAPPRPHKRGGFWHLARRVPTKYRAFDTRGMIIHSTGIRITDDPHGKAAKSAVAEMDAALWERWKELAAGRDPDAKARHQAAVATAGANGLTYAPAAEVAQLPARQLADRIQVLANPVKETDHKIAAVLGGVPVPPLMLSKLREEHEALTAASLRKKSPGQMKRWRTQRDTAVATFIEVLGADKPVRALTRDDVLALRKHWQARITNGEIEIDTANKNISRVAGMVRTVNDINVLGLPGIFDNALIRGKQDKQRVPYLPEFVQARFLVDGLFDDLNEEARRVMFLMVETGVRPSEACNLNRSTIILDHKIPHVLVLPDGREIKTQQSQRIIPLVGVSLMAMQKQPEGFPRYRDNANSLSALVNKALHARNLCPNGETLYSLRHMFKDRLRAARCDSELRNHLMGHKCKEPPYGFGWPLEMKLEVLERIAFKAPKAV